MVSKLGAAKIVYVLVQAICSIWNGFMDAAWGLIGQTPEQISPESWRLAMGSLMDIFTPIGVALLTVFFLISYIQNALDLKEEINYEKIIKMLLQLALIQVAFVSIVKVIPLACSAASSLVRKLQGVGGMGGAHLSPEKFSSIPWDDLGLFSVIVGFVIAILILIVAIVCGAVIVWSVLGRAFKIFVLTPIAAVPLSTMAGGSRTQRPAVNWIKEFLLAVFEVVVIGIVLIIGSSYINSNVIANYFQFDGNDVLLQTIIGLVMIGINMGVVTGAVKGCEAMLRKIY